MQHNELLEKLAERDKLAIDPVSAAVFGTGGAIVGGTLALGLLSAAVSDFVKTQKRNKNRVHTFDANRTLPLKQAGLVTMALPTLAGMGIGSKIEDSFGDHDYSTRAGARRAVKSNDKAKAIGAMAGLLAGILLNRGGQKMRSFSPFIT